MNLDSEWFESIKNGRKKVECRPGNKPISTGPVTFVNRETSEKLECVIVQILRYNTFKEAVEVHGLENVLPTRTDSTVDEAISDVYYKIKAGKPDSYENLEKEHGVQALLIVNQFK